MALQKDTAVSTNERSERSSERNEEEYVSVLGYFRDLPIHHFLKSSKKYLSIRMPYEERYHILQNMRKGMFFRNNRTKETFGNSIKIRNDVKPLEEDALKESRTESIAHQYSQMKIPR